MLRQQQAKAAEQRMQEQTENGVEEVIWHSPMEYAKYMTAT